MRESYLNRQKESSMLLSIGYQKRTVPEVISLLKHHGVEILVDVRSKPYGRAYHFNKKAFSQALAENGIEYLWKGDTLGGFSQIAEDSIMNLSAWQEDKKACLMCMEADPLQCHRHYEIAKRLRGYNVQVGHIIGSNGNMRIGWSFSC